MALHRRSLRLVGALDLSYPEASSPSQHTYSRREKLSHGGCSRASLWPAGWGLMLFTERDLRAPMTASRMMTKMMSVTMTMIKKTRSIDRVMSPYREFCILRALDGWTDGYSASGVWVLKIITCSARPGGGIDVYLLRYYLFTLLTFLETEPWRGRAEEDVIFMNP